MGTSKMMSWKRRVKVSLIKQCLKAETGAASAFSLSKHVVQEKDESENGLEPTVLSKLMAHLLKFGQMRFSQLELFERDGGPAFKLAVRDVCEVINLLLIGTVEEPAARD